MAANEAACRTRQSTRTGPTKSARSTSSLGSSCNRTEADIAIGVADHGRWRVPTIITTYRGHGGPMMLACIDQVAMDRGSNGTTVMMISAATSPLSTGEYLVRDRPAEQPPA